MWALAVWPALRFVPASRAFAFSQFCFVVSFFNLSVWFVVACLEDFRNSFAVAFGPNDVTGHKSAAKLAATRLQMANISQFR
jgi:hypothetical protein